MLGVPRAGYKVEQRPSFGKPTGRDDKDPDYKLEGREFDCYAPSAKKSVRNIWSHVKDEKIDEGQTDRVVLSLADWDGDVAALRTQFKQWPMKGLHEVLLVLKDGSVDRLEL